jgi:hypothetical protein
VATAEHMRCTSRVLRVLTLLFALAFAGCGPSLDLPERPDAGFAPEDGEDPRCPNVITPSSECTIERLDCPSGRAGSRCVCRSDEWYCRPA